MSLLLRPRAARPFLGAAARVCAPRWANHAPCSVWPRPPLLSPVPPAGVPFLSLSAVSSPSAMADSALAGAPAANAPPSSGGSQQVIIGITGTNGAGKGTVVEVLMQDLGFKHYSARSYLSKVLVEQGKELTRGNMNELANALRAADHPAILIMKLLEEAQKDATGRAIIESIRTPGEAALLRKFKNFRLLAVDADPAVRYKRVVVRGSSTDKVTFEQFQADEKKEMASEDPNKQNISKCFEMADATLHNDGTLEDLRKQIDAYVATLGLSSGSDSATGSGTASAGGDSAAAVTGDAAPATKKPRAAPVRKIQLNTSNEGKYAEFVRMFAAVPGSNVELTRTSVDLDEVDGTPLEVIANKATMAGEGVLVEDTCLDVDGSGFAGINIRWMLQNLDQCIGKRAVFTVRLGIVREGAVDVFAGETVGKIVEKRGAGGFGFDPVFLPDGSTLTLAENKDDAFNSRCKAIQKMVSGDAAARLPLLHSEDWTGKWQH